MMSQAKSLEPHPDLKLGTTSGSRSKFASIRRFHESPQVDNAEGYIYVIEGHDAQIIFL